ncbi:glycosyltransferase family 2 protein [Thalassotalea sp. PLHSN55]|uniref:glycosyltransferase family 2 protein n=1 Tax=Thalassotalea sp. PLHSN55 TaxID=3435888 RepID=UPI003F8427B1
MNTDINTPAFTVIIPLYNKAEHILRTLKSVQAQKYPATEIIVIDDGSTDNGAELVAQANIEKLTLIRQKNQGVSATRNNGIAMASCEYIAFLDADDQWLPLYLEETAHLINKFPNAEVFGTKYQIVEGDNVYLDAKIALPALDPDGVILSDYFDIASKGDLPFTMSSVAMKRSLLNKIGGFPVGEPIGEDQDLFCRAALNTQIAYSTNIHSLYHKDAQNQASKLNVPSQECAFSVRVTKKAHQHSHKQKLNMLRYSAAHLCHLAKLNIINGRFTQARSLLADPRCKLKPKHLVGLFAFSYLKQLQGVFARN